MLNRTDELSDLILNNGPSDNTLLLLLNQFKSRGRTGEIIRRCLEAKKRGPNGPGLALLLAEAYLEKGFVGLAEIEIGQVISEIEKYSIAYRLAAEILIRRNRPEDATKLLETYLIHNPDDIEASELLKNIRTVKGRQNETEHEKVRVETFSSDLASPTIAEIYYEQGQINEAINTYEKILLKRSEDQKAQKRLEELKTMNLRDEKTVSSDNRSGSYNKERIRNILEGWIFRIKEQVIEHQRT